MFVCISGGFRIFVLGVRMVVLFLGQLRIFYCGPTILIGFFEARCGLTGAVAPAWLCLGLGLPLVCINTHSSRANMQK